MNVIVTGASRGIGYYIVQSLLKERVTKIVGISRNYKQLCQLKELCAETSGTEFIPVAYDFTHVTVNEPQLAGLIKQHFTHVDILINNAGTLVNKPFEQISAEEITRILTVNYTAPALLIRNLLPLLRAAKQSHVVNITSMGGFQGSIKFKGLTHYSASKAALASLTECLAEEFKNEGLIFNALALGAVQTEMLEQAFPNYKAPLTPEQMGDFIAKFAIHGKAFFNGKVLPVSLTTP
jgi:NAD(P)-dependent dehydrogenase (short-subunit alcohol dehydrogenase family)